MSKWRFKTITEMKEQYGRNFRDDIDAEYQSFMENLWGKAITANMVYLESIDNMMEHDGMVQLRTSYLDDIDNWISYDMITINDDNEEFEINLTNNYAGKET